MITQFAFEEIVKCIRVPTLHVQRGDWEPPFVGAVEKKDCSKTKYRYQSIANCLK